MATIKEIKDVFNPHEERLKELRYIIRLVKDFQKKWEEENIKENTAKHLDYVNVDLDEAESNILHTQEKEKNENLNN
jgi:hypothetical protein